MYEKLTKFTNFMWYLPKKLSKCLLYWCGRYSYTQSHSPSRIWAVVKQERQCGWEVIIPSTIVN